MRVKSLLGKTANLTFRFVTKDKQDSLAMCALEIFTNNKKITMDQSKFGSNTDKKLSKIIELIDQNIN